MISDENGRKYFYRGFSRSAGRGGDLYVLRKNDGWHLNAGVSCWGHDPGFGVYYNVSRNSEEFNDYEQFLKKTDELQRFIKSELGAEDDVCSETFREIWDYIHQTGCN